MDQTAQLRHLALSQPRSILLEDSRLPAEGQGRSLFFTGPVAWHEANSLSDLPALFAHLEAACAAGLWCAGFFSYECGFHFEPTVAPDFVPEPGGLPLAAMGIYREPVRFQALAQSARTHGTPAPALEISREVFARKIDRIHELIESGDTYQANFTDRVCTQHSGRPEDLFAHVMQAQRVAFGALFRVGKTAVLSASPELFFHLRDRQITVRPMKGTAPAGATSAERRAQAQALAADPKNRAENLMIADLMRSDLGRVAETGSVRVANLFAVEQLGALLQMTTEITATLRPEITLYRLFAALFPSGSIVGAPKVRTMQLLRELETRDRGLYTGAIGFLSPDGEATFSVAIRTALLHAGSLAMGVGAGITYDSTAASEYEECRLKANFLMDQNFDLLTTVRLEGGKCFLLPLHLDRLAADAEVFGFAFDRAALGTALEQAAAEHASEPPAKLRVVVDRSGDWKFDPPEAIEPDLPGLRAMLWPDRVRSDDSFLQHKTTHRPVYSAAIREARRLGFTDALFQNEHGVVTEGAIHSIFVRHGDRWRTPPLSAGVLPGVFRTHLLQTMPEVREEPFMVEELFSADEVWLTNAVRGIRKVSVERPAPSPNN